MLRSILVAAALSTLAGAASAQEVDAPPPWLVACTNQRDAGELLCEMSQSIVLLEGNQRLATVALVKSASEDDITGNFTLPVGLYLPAGLSTSVDGAELGNLDFQSCDAQGCYASAPLEQSWLDAMRAGDVLTLDIERLDQEVLSLGVDLAGFGQVFDLMP